MAGGATEAEVRFFLDRGLGSRIVPEALRQAGWVLETMDERYGKDESQNIPDTQWIEEATLAGDVLLCKDVAIAHNPLEAQVIICPMRGYSLCPKRTWQDAPCVNGSWRTKPRYSPPRPERADRM